MPFLNGFCFCAAHIQLIAANANTKQIGGTDMNSSAHSEYRSAIVIFDQAITY